VDIYSLERNLGHGHLTPNNILIVDEERLLVKIQDLGDKSLRKHARIFKNYDYRSVFSCPEVLEHALDKLEP
jgi:hypothetical protein